MEDMTQMIWRTVREEGEEQKMSDMDTLRKAIKREMEEREIDEQEVGEESGVDSFLISHFLNGRDFLNARALNKLKEWCDYYEEPEDNSQKERERTNSISQEEIDQLKEWIRYLSSFHEVLKLMSKVISELEYHREQQAKRCEEAQEAIENPNPLLSKKLKIGTIVLVRDTDEQFWTADIFVTHIAGRDYPYVCTRSIYKQCIPYLGNEHLLYKNR